MKLSASLVVTLLIVLLAAAWQGGVAGASHGDLRIVGAPAVVSYQGQVTVAGAAYTGTGYFKFAIIDATPTSHWSNDGTSVGGEEPAKPVALDVSAGLFNVCWATHHWRT